MMLYLRLTSPTGSDALGRPIGIAESSAHRLEAALLAADPESRTRLLLAALTADSALADWALCVATRDGATLSTLDTAANWLSPRLATELARALAGTERTPDPANDIHWRLPALSARLSESERQSREFERRLEQEKLASLKELAYGASHEINNPLANIAARAQTLLQDETDAERQRKLAAIHRQAMRAHEMISDLMLFARPPKLEPAACDLSQIVAIVVDEHRPLAEERQIKLLYDAANAHLEVVADATQLAVAIAAVLVNSIEAVGLGGKVEVAVRRAHFADQSCAEVAVRDDGPGISPEIRRHMFDPFFSGREAGRGLGFGLSKCWRIVTDHGGQVIVNQPAGRGAEIALRLPV